MILTSINQKMPIYKGCTLTEMMVVGTSVLVTLGVSLSIIFHFIIGYAWVGIIISILLLIPMTRLFLGKLQKMKVGKPENYYQQFLLKKLNRMGLISLPYVQREGKWSLTRD